MHPTIFYLLRVFYSKKKNSNMKNLFVKKSISHIFSSESLSKFEDTCDMIYGYKKPIMKALMGTRPVAEVLRVTCEKTHVP